MILADVYEAYREDPAFSHLRTDGIVLVPGEGSSNPTVFIVGEAPGATENTQQRPFVGASGAVLRSLIDDVAGLRPGHHFITNVVKYRPPGNRTPTWEEVDASRPHLRAEYGALGSPPVIVTVGRPARDAIMPEWADGILTTAGKRFELGTDRTLWTMVHPSYALRNKAYRPYMEQHWTEFGDWIREEFG